MTERRSIARGMATAVCAALALAVCIMIAVAVYRSRNEPPLSPIVEPPLIEPVASASVPDTRPLDLSRIPSFLDTNPVPDYADTLPQPIAKPLTFAARVAVPPPAKIGDTILLDASKSIGTKLAYRWEIRWPSGNTEVVVTNIPKVMVAASVTGVAHATLFVGDGEGRVDTANFGIQVAE